MAPESWSNRWTDNRDGIYVLGDHLSGGIGRDTLIGNDLENELNGGAGADVMIGGAGSDFYIVDDAGDVVMEHHHGGVDVVLSSISYILSDNVEKLILAANAGDLNGAGNAQNNTLIGNEGRNVLSGGAGNDWLNGASGDDTLIGGEGQDVFYV
ncbi:MAG: calcium-binding protein, partial [bacterium]